MAKKIITLSLLLILGMSIFIPLAVNANGHGPAAPLTLPNPLGTTTTTVYQLIERIVNWLITIGGVIAVGMIIWGAIQMITAGGSPEKIEKAKKTILWTVVGYAIILIGWGIEKIITKLLNP